MGTQLCGARYPPAMSPDDLAAELLDAVLDADPLAGSLYGLPGYDDRLPDFGREAEDGFTSTVASIADRAEASTTEGLDETGRQTLDFVRHMARAMAGAAEVPVVEFTICDTFAAPVGAVLTMLPKVPLDTGPRRDDYLTRLAGLGGMLATAAGRHREGTGAGRTAVARLVRSAIAQLDLMMTDPSAGGLARPDEDDATFGPRVRAAVDDDVRPALAAYRDSLRDDVLPAARDDDHPGICFLPDGGSMYRALTRLHSSTDATPDELHALGQEIVGQVRAELVGTGRQLFGTSDLREIFDRLSNDPTQRYGSRDEMLGHARRVVAAAEVAAPAWFTTVPDEPCSVEPVPEAEEAGSPPAYYMTGAVDGSRHGTYFLNTSEPGERHRYMAEDMAFHEAVPGHHFQLTLAMESRDLPPARRMLSDTACAEGWGLYSERLADEMGLYSDDTARMGLFAADSWRASRLVVDTGLHALGWTRDQAVAWMAAHTPLPPIEIDAEVDRYISYPGQALSYMVGRREIERLRAASTEALGDAFDIKEFHDVILRAGIMPLAALAGTVERWVSRTGG